MARLYWRIKKNGKWTWQPAIYDLHNALEVMREVVHEDAELVTLWWPTEEEDDDPSEDYCRAVEEEEE